MGKEFLNNIPRYCLWLKDANLAEVRQFDLIYQRIQNVKDFREKSKRPQTLKAAKFPALFGEERHPDSDYLAIPKVSSENRDFIPIGYCSKDIICGDKLFNMPNASVYHFGIITSTMHNAWTRTVCGRMKSDISYSNTIVYNNYPWPNQPSDKLRANIETAAQAVLDARAAHKDASLADLYDPLTMPANLVKAHATLDKAVDAAYGFKGSFDNERVAFLFDLYQTYTSSLVFDAPAKPKRRKKS